ncbi:MAG: peptidylprolyl isomerase [Flavobacteriales bacterium]|nr:peptidylprolyl isomerase [Flavobacteriales bacterium]
MKKALLSILVFTLFFLSCSKDEKKPGMYAKIITNKGDIVVSLTYEKTPLTVASFVCLAEGLMPDLDKPFYDGLKFHRVIPNFMIQGGCPLGTGTGDPGYKFSDEFHPDLKHDGPGVLSMANSGPNTNGSQFFITHQETPWLDNKHSIFGRIDTLDTESQAVVDAIEQGDEIQKIEIIRDGRDAKKFDALKTFNEKMEEAKEMEAKAQEEMQQKLKELSENAVTTASGLSYKVINSGSGKAYPKSTDVVKVHYTGMNVDGSVFDSSVERGQPVQFPLDKVIPGWTEGLQLMVVGDKFTFIIPPDLAYGAGGRPPVIAPNATLIFEVELLGIGE